MEVTSAPPSPPTADPRTGAWGQPSQTCLAPSSEPSPAARSSIGRPGRNELRTRPALAIFAAVAGADQTAVVVVQRAPIGIRSLPGGTVACKGGRLRRRVGIEERDGVRDCRIDRGRR